MISTLEMVETVRDCPVLRLASEKNELGLSCNECEAADPERAAVCVRLFRGEEPEILPDLTVKFRETDFNQAGNRPRTRPGETGEAQQEGEIQMQISQAVEELRALGADVYLSEGAVICKHPNKRLLNSQQRQQLETRMAMLNANVGEVKEFLSSPQEVQAFIEKEEKRLSEQARYGGSNRLGMEIYDAIEAAQKHFGEEAVARWDKEMNTSRR